MGCGVCFKPRREKRRFHFPPFFLLILPLHPQNSRLILCAESTLTVALEVIVRWDNGRTPDLCFVCPSWTGVFVCLLVSPFVPSLSFWIMVALVTVNRQNKGNSISQLRLKCTKKKNYLLLMLSLRYRCMKAYIRFSVQGVWINVSHAALALL